MIGSFTARFELRVKAILAALTSLTGLSQDAYQLLRAPRLPHRLGIIKLRFRSAPKLSSLRRFSRNLAQKIAVQLLLITILF